MADYRPDRSRREQKKDLSDQFWQTECGRDDQHGPECSSAEVGSNCEPIKTDRVSGCQYGAENWPTKIGSLQRVGRYSGRSRRLDIFIKDRENPVKI